MSSPNPIPGYAPAQPAETAAPQQGPAIPWYRSQVIIAQVSSAVSGSIAILPKSATLQALGLENPETVSGYITVVFGVIAAVAQVMAVIARARSNLQPVTLTKTGAEMHPNTLAVTNPPPVVKPVDKT